MTRYTLICAALLIAAPAAAQDQGSATLNDDLSMEPVELRSDATGFDFARKKVVDCEGEKFVFAWGAGARPTKVTLCSKKDASRDDLVEMLDDAATKLDKSNLAEDRKVAIVQQIRAKIAELQGASSAAALPAPIAKPPAAIAEIPVASPRAASPPAVRPVASSVPAKASASVGAAKPRLKFDCDSPTDPGSAGPCVFLKRDTRLTITAGEAVPDGIGLRFLRRGEMRAEVALGSLRKGQSARLVLPSKLCSGISRSVSRIEVVRSGQVVDSIGPFSLRC